MEPVTIQVELELLKMIRQALTECAEDVRAYVDAEYPEKMREQYPTYARRHQRDMSAVVDASYCLDQLNKLPGPRETE